MGQTGPGRHPMNIVNNVYCGGQSVRMQSNAMNVGEQLITDQTCSIRMQICIFYLYCLGI